MVFENLKFDIKSRAKQYSINSDSHKCFVGEYVGFNEGVEWTLNKLYQLGYLDNKLDDNRKDGFDEL